MSGPKGYDVALERRLQRERELAARRRSWATAHDVLVELRNELRRDAVEFDVAVALARAGFGSTRSEHPSEADLDELAHFQATVETVVSEARRARTDAYVLRTRSALVGRTTSPTHDADPRAQDDIAPSAERLVELLAEVPDAMRDPLTLQVAELVATDANGSSRSWLTLTRTITDAVRASRDAVLRDRLARELKSVIARIEGPTADDLRAQLAAATDSTAVERLRPRVLAAVTAAEHESERAHVVRSAIEVWRELGYVADADLVDLTLAGGSGLLKRDEWPDHALQIRLASDGLSIGTNVVALTETDPRRDLEVEEESCRDIGTFMRGLDARGLSTRLSRHKAPGELPVQRLRHRDESSITAPKAEQDSARREQH